MVGAAFSHYRILGHLGSGGMGAVYHAVDTDLDRAVAVKFLRPEFAMQADRRDRFLQEARAAAALTHPNICTIHEVGRFGDQLFIVMQLVGGVTLAETIAAKTLRPERVGQIGLQLAGALGAAHARGIVHRDLKPSNIMVTPTGDVMVLDFGVAAVLKDQFQLGDTSTATAYPWIAPGSVVGTIGYMAPEQIRGEPASPASDVFSLGVTLYEAATGRNPFRRDSSLQTIAAVLDSQVTPVRASAPGFPEQLDHVILRCLDKRMGLRYHDGTAVAAALSEPPAVKRGRPLTAPLTATPRSLAVLPFANVAGDPADEYLSEGLPTEITTKLSRLKGLRVISRSATQRYRHSQLDACQIGRELGVGTVLEGAISRRGQRLRITVQLLGVETGYCLWSDSCDLPLDNLVQIEERVSNRVARALKATFRGVEPPLAARAHGEAYRLYLQGKMLFYRFNSTDNLLAIDAFRRALTIDSRYAAAHAALASACMARLDRQWEAEDERWMADALKACEEAIALDGWSSEAYSARGLVMLRRRQVAEAETEFRRALAINQNDDIAHGMLGQIHFERGDLAWAGRAYKRALKISPDYVWFWNDLAWVDWLLGRYAETERSLARVLSINPLDEIARVGIATGHYFLGELDSAIAAAQKAVEINPQHPFTRPVLAVALAARGRVDEGVAICRDTLGTRPDDFLASAALGVVHAVAGDTARMQTANEHALAIPAPRLPLNLNIAVHYAFLNQATAARAWLDKALREGMRVSGVVEHNPLLRQFAPAFPDNTRLRRRRDDARRDKAVFDVDQGGADGKKQPAAPRLDQ